MSGSVDQHIVNFNKDFETWDIELPQEDRRLENSFWEHNEHVSRELESKGLGIMHLVAQNAPIPCIQKTPKVLKIFRLL